MRQAGKHIKLVVLNYVDGTIAPRILASRGLGRGREMTFLANLACKYTNYFLYQ